jgi:hypothetical protein
LTIRALAALADLNARYWSTVAPTVRAELADWNRRAHAIDTPVLRALAVEKLNAEGFNAEVAATVVTSAPRPHRKQAVRAVVALTVLYDYLDGLGELRAGAPLDSGRALFQALPDALDPSADPSGDYYRDRLHCDDGGYLQRLVTATQSALAALPAASATAEVMRASAVRCAEAQVRAHAAQYAGVEQARTWAIAEASPTSLGWREFLAGAASSVLAIHALIAAAADGRTTHDRAVELDNLYRPICVLPSLLDSLVDYREDTQAGKRGFLDYYENWDSLTRALGETVAQVLERARTAPDGPRHLMISAGVVAYYSTHPGAGDELAEPVIDGLLRHLQPLAAPAVAVLRAWRLGKRLRQHGRRGGASASRAATSASGVQGQ